MTIGYRGTSIPNSLLRLMNERGKRRNLSQPYFFQTLKKRVIVSRVVRHIN